MKGLASKMQRFIVSENRPTVVDLVVLLSLIAFLWLILAASISPRPNAMF